MLKRKLKDYSSNKSFINPIDLHLDDFKEELDKLKLIKNVEDKVYFMTSYLENQIPPFDIFSDLYYDNEDNFNNLPNDLIQYYLIFILAILDNDIMKKYFPKFDISEYNFIISEENPLSMTKKLFKALFSLLFSTNNSSVKYTIIKLMYNYSYYSDDFLFYCTEDLRYIRKLFSLSYYNNLEVLRSIIFIFRNIFVFEGIENDKISKILQDCSIIIRCKEFLSMEKLNSNLKTETLNLLLSIINRIENKDYRIYFDDFIPTFFNILNQRKGFGNEEIFLLILKIIRKLTNDENICFHIVSSGMGYILYQMLSVPNLQQEFMVKLLDIFSDLFFEDEIIKYFFNIDRGNITKVFINILNTYMNTANEKDNILIKKLLFCLSNFVTGGINHLLVHSQIPELVQKIMKIKLENKIYFEGVNFFYNIIYSGDKETFAIISEFKPFKLFAKGLEFSAIPENISLSLKGIILLLEKNKEIYHTLENLKREFYACMAKRKIEELIEHKNEEISHLAEKIITILFEENQMDEC